MPTLQSINLTDNQKRVLTKIVAAPTPTVAGNQLSGDENLVAARNTLVKLGMIILSPKGEVTLTDRGTEALQRNALIDDNGELTNDGKQFASTDEKGNLDVDNPAMPQKTNAVDNTPMLGGPSGPPVNAPESKEYGEKFNLLKEFLN